MKKFDLNNYNANRYDEAQPHRDAGNRWGNIALAVAVPVILLWPINKAVEDVVWTVVLLAIQLAGLGFQIFAFVKSARAHKRANKILGW